MEGTSQNRDTGSNTASRHLAEPSSDLGRRLRHRREALGISLHAAAALARIDPGYLDYLETAPVPDPPQGTLLRLALALSTSPASLLGSDRSVPPGSGPDRPPAEVVALDAQTSLRLIAPGGVGRVVFVDERGPVALPVNYKMQDGRIVFRTDDGSSIATGASSDRVSFEVDRLDDAFSEGWSVLVTGSAHRIDEEEDARLAQAADVRSWAAGERHRYVVLEPELVTGRELRHDPRET